MYVIVGVQLGDLGKVWTVKVAGTSRKSPEDELENLLNELVKNHPKMTFQVLWRNT
jgi:hypothetical protein